MQSDTGKQAGDEGVQSNENDLSLNVFPRSKAKMIYSRRDKCLYLCWGEIHEPNAGDEDINGENNTQDGAIPEDTLFDTLYEDGNEGLEMNEEDRCSGLMWRIVYPLKFGIYPKLNMYMNVSSNANSKSL